MTDVSVAAVSWCPFARVLFSDEDGAAGFNRRGSEAPEKTARCITSRCMAWREHPPTTWHEFPTEAEAQAFAQAQPTAELHGEDGFGPGWSVEVGPSGGFCGLAGATGAP